MTDAETIIARVYAAEKCWNAHREEGVCWACDYCEEARRLAADIARALRDAALLPDATTRDELSLRRADGVVCGPAAGDESYLRDFANRYRATVMRRTRTTYADHVTEWEPAE